MVDLAEVTLKANSFSAWRETYPETWDWKPLVIRHEHLQAKVEQAGAMPPSIKPVIREEFRSGSKSEDAAFAELSTLQDICQVLATIQDSMVPRERSPDIQFRCVLTQLWSARSACINHMHCDYDVFPVLSQGRRHCSPRGLWMARGHPRMGQPAPDVTGMGRRERQGQGAAMDRPPPREPLV